MIRYDVSSDIPCDAPRLLCGSVESTKNKTFSNLCYTEVVEAGKDPNKDSD